MKISKNTIDGIATVLCACMFSLPLSAQSYSGGGRVAGALRPGIGVPPTARMQPIPGQRPRASMRPQPNLPLHGPGREPGRGPMYEPSRGPRPTVLPSQLNPVPKPGYQPRPLTNPYDRPGYMPNWGGS